MRACGSVTCRKVESGPAPRSYDASSSCCPIETKRARTTSATTDALKTTWAMRIVCHPSGLSIPSRLPAWTKNTSAAIANTISGVTRVMYASASIGVRTHGRMRGSASASIVPSTQATMAFPSAMRMLNFRALVISGVSSATLNHFVEKPCQ